MLTQAPQSVPSARSQPGWQFAVGSGILGWVLDAFDFFVMVFLFDILSAHFHVHKTAIIATLPLTLAMRPVGAFLFGALADRFGRRIPLMVCVLYFSLATVLSGLAPSFGFFVVMRALYGIGMGGYWGIGASYAMESSPIRFRGVLSGMMQAGYPLGYLLAAAMMQFVVPGWGWHAVFYVGMPFALLVVALTLFAPESKAWQQHREPSVGKIFSAVYQHSGIFFYILTMMAVMLCLSHGTQDLYPDFLRSIHGLTEKTILGMKTLYGIPIVYNVAGIFGAVLFGHFSQEIGRRKAILFALAVCFLSIPAWAYGTSLVVVVAGSCLMQAGVQGAWGVIPAHLNELSPDSVRSLFPGFAYQMGVLISSPAVLMETWLKNRSGYPLALAMFEAWVLGLLVVILWFGPEAHGRSFIGGETEGA